MQYLIDIGSSTVKVYERQQGVVELVDAWTFSFKDGFDAERGLSDASRGGLLSYFDAIRARFSLTRGNTKIFATGIFRELANRQSFVEDFYSHTNLYFNVVSHSLEEFYLEKAWTGRCDSRSPLLVINIGGRTTELVFYREGEVAGREMLSLGVGTLLGKFPSLNERLSSYSLGEIVKEIVSELPVTGQRFESAIYTGGELTYMKIAGYSLQSNSLFVDERHPYEISLKDYSARNTEVFSEVSISDLRSLMPSNPNWMDGARACSAIAQAICVHYGVETIIPSDSNLIDGVNVQEADRVVLCGSFNRQLESISKLAEQLRARGIDVLSPRSTDIIGHEGGFVLFEGDEIVNRCTWSVESLHLRAIESCDTVVVCNFDDYVGTKTALEIGYAYRCGKRIVFLNDGPVVADFDLPSEVGLLAD